MRHPAWILLVILAACRVTVAQDSRPSSAVSATVLDLRDQWTAAKRAFDAKRRLVKTPAERVALEKERPEPEIWNPRFWEIVRANPLDPGAADALTIILESAEGDEETLAVDHLLRVPVDAEALKRLPDVLAKRTTPATAASIGRLIDAHWAPDIRAKIAHGAALARTESWRRGDSEAEKADGRDAIVLWKSIGERFGDIRIGEKSSERFGDLATGYLGEIAHLGIGMTAPEIVGKDTEGGTFKLSDYRGKAVIVLFWGLWTGAYKAFRADEWVIVEEFKDEPFALIGINTDQSVDRLKRASRGQDINWRQVFDGPKGPIARAWNVRTFPALFMIDGTGRIRYRDVFDGEMRTALRQLFEEAKVALESLPPSEGAAPRKAGEDAPPNRAQ